MIDIFEKQFDKLSKKIKDNLKSFFKRLRAYFKKLLLPLYLFPIKLLTYTIYYLVKFLIKLLISLIKIIIDSIIFPFRSLKNLLKSLFILALVVYMAASLFVIADYLRTQYGWYGKFFCSVGTGDRMKDSVVRIVGGYSEGSGFFITQNKVLTNFHVVANEPSPKIIFPDGSFTTPVKITGDKEADLAILLIKESKLDLVLDFLNPFGLLDQEPLLAVGYPLGTDLSGEATVLRGDFLSFRQTKYDPVYYIQTDINLVEGMSGGPLVDQCGDVVGVNTLSIGGLSFFISAEEVQRLMMKFTDQDITKIDVDPSVSPEEAVKAFYTYLKARRMKDGFNLLSKEYLKKTNFEEWTSRFTDVLDVNVFLSEPYENTDDTAFVKFLTKNWVDGEAEIHYYEGTWQTVEEDDVYKMLESKVKEVENPEWEWFYE